MQYKNNINITYFIKLHVTKFIIIRPILFLVV